MTLLDVLKSMAALHNARRKEKSSLYIMNVNSNRRSAALRQVTASYKQAAAPLTTRIYSDLKTLNALSQQLDDLIYSDPVLMRARAEGADQDLQSLKRLVEKIADVAEQIRYRS